MSEIQLRPVLEGQKALVIGIANKDSIAYGCAKAFRSVGADLAVSWLNEKARGFVEPLARELEASITGEVDVSDPGQMEAIFDQIRKRWGRLDILVHPMSSAATMLPESSRTLRGFGCLRPKSGSARRRISGR